MKKDTLITALTALLLSVLSASRTHNNGDIGKIFGKWKLTYIEATDTEKPETGGTHVRSFQSSTVFVQINDGSHDEIGSYGNFRLADETLFPRLRRHGLSEPDSRHRTAVGMAAV